MRAEDEGFGFWRKVKDFFIGATIYGAIRDLQERRLLMEYGLMLAAIGDMLGFPLPNYYRLRLIPYWLPRVKEWKSFLLRERDVTGKI